MVPFGGALEPLVRRMSRAARQEHVWLPSAPPRASRGRRQSRPRPSRARVLYAAGSTGDEKLLNLLGGALGDAANGAHEDGALLVGVLVSLRPSHLTVMETLSREPPPASDVQGAVGHWWLSAVRSESGLSEHVVSLCVSELASRGVVRTGYVSRRRLLAHAPGAHDARGPEGSRRGGSRRIGVRGAVGCAEARQRRSEGSHRGALRSCARRRRALHQKAKFSRRPERPPERSRTCRVEDVGRRTEKRAVSDRPTNCLGESWSGRRFQVPSLVPWSKAPLWRRTPLARYQVQTPCSSPRSYPPSERRRPSPATWHQCPTRSPSRYSPVMVPPWGSGSDHRPDLRPAASKELGWSSELMRG